MVAGDQPQSRFQVAPQLVGGARLARIIARDCQSSADCVRAAFKSAHIIALPTVERDRDPTHSVNRPFVSTPSSANRSLAWA